LCIGGQQWPTQSQPRHFQSGAQRQPCCLHPSGAPTHLPLSRPFCCRRTYSEVIAGSDVTRGKFHACPDRDKCFPVGNGRRSGQEDCFLNPFVHRRTAVARSEPTKAFSKRSPETAMLSEPFRCTHPPPPVPPALSAVAEPNVKSLQKVTSQEESFMPDISGYIRERVNNR